MTVRIAIGVGCRLGCSADTIEALVQQALVQQALIQQALIQHALTPQALTRHATRRALTQRALIQQAATAAPAAERPGLFTIRDKIGEPGLTEAASRLRLNLIFLPREALREQAPSVLTRSIRTEQLFGVPSVAEAAALAGAGAGSELVVPRIASQGATCAIARSHKGLA